MTKPMECYLRETELTTEYTQYTVFSSSEEERGIAVFAGNGDLTPGPTPCDERGRG
jgi:hypothetical protein